MIIDIDRAAGVVTKKAETPAEVARLRAEGAVLKQARHPGVVELIGREDRGELRFRAIDARCLADCLADSQPWTTPQVTAFAAEAATTVADLHDIGIIHGQLTARHVLIDSDRRPVLCSLGHQADGPEDDVAAIGQLLRQLRSRIASGGGDSRAGRALDHSIVLATHPDPGRRPTARALARRLAEPVRPRRRPALRRPALAAAAGLVVLLTTAILLRPGWTGPAGRLQVSEPADPIAVGRWSCRAPLPALLQPATGDVWVWDGWPRGPQPVTGRLIARVAGATSFRAVKGRGGCDTLLIVRRTGPALAIDPSPRS